MDRENTQSCAMLMCCLGSGKCTPMPNCCIIWRKVQRAGRHAFRAESATISYACLPSAWSVAFASRASWVAWVLRIFTCSLPTNAAARATSAVRVLTYEYASSCDAKLRLSLSSGSVHGEQFGCGTAYLRGANGSSTLAACIVSIGYSSSAKCVSAPRGHAQEAASV
jgi:hypothetical protein